MIKSFEFFSDVLNKTLNVEIDIDGNEDEAWINSMEITDETFEVIPEKSLSPDELRSINNQADEIANEHGYEAYLDSLEAKGDFAYDMMRDREMELASMADEIMNESDGYMISEDENN